MFLLVHEKKNPLKYDRAAEKVKTIGNENYKIVEFPDWTPP